MARSLPKIRLVPSAYDTVKNKLRDEPKSWLVTGAAGFIGSCLVETLLRLDQSVVGLDNFSTGSRRNLQEVRGLVSEEQWGRLRPIEGDVRNPEDCRHACGGVNYVLHQAALGSVPHSVDDPALANENNVTGTLNMLVAARDAGVGRFVYASSSAVYGDDAAPIKVEGQIGHPLSPYAVTKYVDELYGEIFARTYGTGTVGLRYFNIFGRRQDPNGAYAAVIPRWFSSLLQGEEVHIYGDGETSRDFCYVGDVAQANILAACTKDDAALNQVYNVGLSKSTTLNELFALIRDEVAKVRPEAARTEPMYGDFRIGDVRHSLADVSKSKKLLGFDPAYTVGDGLAEAAAWYRDSLAS